MSQEAKQALGSLCDGLGVEAATGWFSYFDAVKQWGARTDLTAAKNDAELCEILFLDAAALMRGGWSTETLVDVGAGVGAPTLPLLLADVAASALLVEPRRRRVAFLRSVIGTVGLPGRAVVREGKVDASSPSLPGTPFGAALSRATFDAETWRRIGAHLAMEVWVFTAGTTPEDSDAFELTRTLHYEVPSTGAPRSILAYRRRDGRVAD